MFNDKMIEDWKIVIKIVLRVKNPTLSVILFVFRIFFTEFGT